MKRRVPPPLLLLVACAWLIAVTAGLRMLWAYSTQPGRSTPAAVTWPQATSLARDPRLPTLIMFVHPQCPCSRASAEELSRLMSRTSGQLSVQVVAILPEGATDDWSSSGLIERIRRIPGVSVSVDRGGREAERFGARTSGHTNLYDPHGRLLFSGGITAARGHAGDNAGSDAIVTLVSNSSARCSTTSVFGCSLMGEQTSCKAGAR